MVSILCSPVIVVQYLLLSCKSKGPLQTVFSIFCAPIGLLQYLIGILLGNKVYPKKLPPEKLKTILVTGASIQGKTILRSSIIDVTPEKKGG